MSSAILYLAIVAIWAVVLVPRWLRPRAAPPQPVPAPVPASPQPVPVPAESPDAELREPAGPEREAGVAEAVGTDGPDAAGAPVAGTPVAGPPGAGPPVAGPPVAGAFGAGADVSGADARAGEVAPETEAAAPWPALRRAEVLKARRRLLTTLITLTVIAVGLAVTRIDAYWIVVPPVVLLTGYMVLLRQFAHIDAERARRATRIRSAEARARAGEEPASTVTPVVGGSDVHSAAAPGGAEIIDISGRIGDQVYDQYSDAANRAVGD